MTSEPITNSTLSNDAANELEWLIVAIANDGNLIRQGTNTVAVELHQNSTTSSDAHFDMEISLARTSFPSQPGLQPGKHQPPPNG